MSGLLDAAAQGGDLWLIALSTLVGVLGLIVFIQLFQLVALKRRFDAIWRNSKELDLEGLLAEQAQSLETSTAKVNELDRRCTSMEHDARHHLQHVGVVRFNAFADTGSDLSFAIALLDRDLNGVVISSLYGRDESRVYAKPVASGQSTYFLTAEEKEAINRATGTADRKLTVAGKL